MPRHRYPFNACSIRRNLLIACLFWVFHLNAQTPSYLHYDIRDGLPSNLVYCAYQDRKGIMWFGTNNGLASFDGIRFHVYGTKDGLPDPEVLGLWEDSKERLWIANFRQRPCYLKNGEIISSKKDSLLALLKVDEVYTFYEDSKGAIHIAHRKPSVYLFQDSIVRKKMYFDALVQGDGINSYVKIGNETFAIGNRIIINARLKQKDSTVYTILTPPPNPYLGVATSGNHLLFSLANGLILFKWENNKLTKINELIGDLTGSVFSDKLGRFWVCSQKYGAVCFDNKNKDFSNPRVYLDKKKITSMTQDQQGTYWFCTIGEGIYTLTVNHADSFNERDGLISKNITAINIDYNNRVWTGDDEGIVHMQKHNNLFTHWLIGPNDGYNRCRQIVPLADNTCWIVSDDYLKWGDGVTMHKSITHAAYKSALVKNNQIWYVSYSHLGYIDLNEKNFGNRIKEIRFTTIGLDINGYVWAGHMEGIYNLHDNFSYNWGNSFPLLKSRIIAIQAADSNHLWVATPTSGLLWVQIHDGTVQKVDIVNERIKKPIENIQSMYREDNGRLWLATNHGVYRLSPDWSVLHLDHTNGLAADDVNAVVVKGDTLWAGTVAGLSRLVLSTLGGDGEFATMISSLRFTLDNQVFTYHLLDSATTRRFTTLTADARIIELDLSALDFTCRGKINFEYIIRQELLPWYFMTPNNLFQWLLNGFSFPSDTTFLEKGTLNLGVQLEPGRYQISITGISGTGARSKYPTEWTIQMAPYWYETVWVVFSALGFILFSAIRFRKNRSFVRKVDNKILHFKLIALQSQVNPHFIGNSVNSIQKFFYPFNFDKASRYITTFTRMLRQSMDFSETSFIPFREEVEYIENYLIMAQLRIGNHFTYEIKGVDKIPGSLMMPVMILQPFVENATIHGVKDEEKSHIIVAFEMQADTFHCAIIDDGPGVRSRANEKKRVRSKRKSKGLEIVSQKVEVLNQLYHLNMVCRVKDRSDGNPLDHGTRVDIYFRHPQTPQKPVAPSI